MDYLVVEMNSEFSMLVSVSVFVEILILVSVERVHEVCYALSLDSRILLYLSVVWEVTE
jgi:hypothetical protein